MFLSIGQSPDKYIFSIKKMEKKVTAEGFVSVAGCEALLVIIFAGKRKMLQSLEPVHRDGFLEEDSRSHWLTMSS